MTLSSFPNQISMSQIRSEIKKPGSNQDLSLGNWRAGGGIMPNGSIGYPEGNRTDIPDTNNPISLGNFHGHTFVQDIPGYNLLDHVWSNRQRYFRFQDTAGTTMGYPGFAGNVGDMYERNMGGALTQGGINFYYDGTNSSLNNLDGSLSRLSEWTTFINFSCGWTPIFNSRTSPQVILYTMINGVETALYKDNGMSLEHNTWGAYESSSADNLLPGGGGNMDPLGWMFQLWHVQTPFTQIKRGTQIVTSISGSSNRPTSQGNLALPGRWRVQDQGTPYDYVTSKQYCVVYRDNNTSSPFRVKTTDSSYANGTGHRLDEGVGSEWTSGRKFDRWRFVDPVNTTFMSPINKLKDYKVELIPDNSEEFYLIDPDTNSYVYPDKSYTTGNTFSNTAGWVMRKKVDIPAGGVQFLFNRRNGSESYWPYDTNTNWNGGWSGTDSFANAGDSGTRTRQPEEANSRKGLLFARADNTDSNSMRLLFNTTNSVQTNTWKHGNLADLASRWHAGYPNIMTRINLYRDTIF
jgi:hypothetical protein